MNDDGQIDFSELAATEQDPHGADAADVIFDAVLDDDCESLAAALGKLGL